MTRTAARLLGLAAVLAVVYPLARAAVGMAWSWHAIQRYAAEVERDGWPGAEVPEGDREGDDFRGYDFLPGGPEYDGEPTGAWFVHRPHHPPTDR